MRKEDKVLLYVAAAGVIAGLVGVWWFMSGNVNPNNQGAAAGSKSMSVKELLALKEPTTCSVSNTTSGGSSSGTVYIVSGLLRGDFTSVVGGQVVQSHLLIKDKSAYVWADKLAQGIKVPFSTSGTSTSASASDTSSPISLIDPNVKANYTCTSWTSNANYFDLPAQIAFKDFPVLSH